MIETVASSLIVMFISSLAYVAYKHPKAFASIYWVLLVVVLLCYLAIAAYDWGITKASGATLSVNLSFGAGDSVRTAINSKEVSWDTTMAICIGFFIYLHARESLLVGY